MKPTSPLGMPIGISLTFWLFIGVWRYIYELLYKKTAQSLPTRYSISDVAVVVPAHNETLVIQRSLQALKKMVPPRQIHVVSDGSSDNTYNLALSEGAYAIDLKPGLGKARALLYLIKKFKLFDRYKFIFILDADITPFPNYLETLLKRFNEPDVAVAFGKSITSWPQHIIPKLKYYFVGYRDRLNFILQHFMTYGLTWGYTNFNFVNPGFGILYRSDILRQLEIDRPGILIEDFNLAFDLHKKKLGKAVFEPKAIAVGQNPDNLVDYWKQVKRWNIGYFQTMKANWVWPSLFWVAVGLFSFEVWFNSFFYMMLPFLMLFFIPSLFISQLHSFLPGFLANFYSEYTLKWGTIFLTIYLIDYATSVVVGIISRKPQLLFYGLFFFFMHFITSVVLLTSFYPGFFKSSDGRWIPPTRRAVD